MSYPPPPSGPWQPYQPAGGPAPQSGPPQSGPPTSGPPQSSPPQSGPPQSGPPGYPPPGYPTPTGYPPPGYPPGYPPPGYPPPGYPPPGYPPRPALNRQRRTGFVLGIVLGAVVLVLCSLGAAGGAWLKWGNRSAQHHMDAVYQQIGAPAGFTQEQQPSKTSSGVSGAYLMHCPNDKCAVDPVQSAVVWATHAGTGMWIPADVQECFEKALCSTANFTLDKCDVNLDAAKRPDGADAVYDLSVAVHCDN